MHKKLTKKDIKALKDKKAKAVNNKKLVKK